MIGFSFIFDARLLIPGRINNESYMSYQLDIRFKIKSPCCDSLYRHTRIKINPLSLLNTPDSQFPSVLWVGGTVTPAQFGKTLLLGELNKAENGMSSHKTLIVSILG